MVRRRVAQLGVILIAALMGLRERLNTLKP
jgi:hypothetical protein